MLLAARLRPLIAAQRAFVTPDDPVEGMRQLVMHSWDHYQSHPHLVRLLMNENLLHGRHIRQSAQLERTTLPLGSPLVMSPGMPLYMKTSSVGSRLSGVHAGPNMPYCSVTSMTQLPPEEESALQTSRLFHPSYF